MLKTTEQKVLKFIDDNLLINKGDKILVALSGGADSVFLFFFLMKFSKRLKIDLSAFHLNHQLRGKDADKDEMFCIKICNENNIKIFSLRKDVRTYAAKNKISIEEAGRVIRYRELIRISQKEKLTKIATAHSLSDNAETVLLNIIKGTGLKGLIGIPVQREKIIRPLLILGSEEIRDYLDQKNIPYRIDRTNFDPEYERSFLRNDIIPKLKQALNPQLEQKLFTVSKILKNTFSYIDEQLKNTGAKAIRVKKNLVEINLDDLKSLDKRLWADFFKKYIDETFETSLTAENINSLLKLINTQKGKRVNLENNLQAIKEERSLVITKIAGNQKTFSSKKIKTGESIILNGAVFSLKIIYGSKIEFSPDRSIEYISADNIQDDFELRRWKAGDRFYPIGMKGSKKISDYLADVKTPVIKKNELLVLTNSGRIVWVVGLRLDDRFKVTGQTKKILKLTYCSGGKTWIK